MAEYINVEKPFLDKLRQIGWMVYDNGAGGVPEDPTESFRTSFKEVILKPKFEAAIKKLNPWITEEQFIYCFDNFSLCFFDNGIPFLDSDCFLFV